MSIKLVTVSTFFLIKKGQQGETICYIVMMQDQAVANAVGEPVGGNAGKFVEIFGNISRML